MTLSLLTTDNATVSIGLSDKDGTPLRKEIAAIFSAHLCYHVRYELRATVHFVGKGTGYYTNNAGKQFEEPSYTVIFDGKSVCMFKLVRYLQVLCRSFNHECIALTWHGKTFAVSP